MLKLIQCKELLLVWAMWTVNPLICIMTNNLILFWPLIYCLSWIPTGNQRVGEQTGIPAEATEWSRGYTMEGHVQEEPTLVAREATDPWELERGVLIMMQLWYVYMLKWKDDQTDHRLSGYLLIFPRLLAQKSC